MFASMLTLVEPQPETLPRRIRNAGVDLPNAFPKTWTVFQRLVALQRVLEADILNKDTSPTARAKVAHAYKEFEELKRLVRMKPAPKPVDTTKAAPRPGRAPGRAKFAPAPRPTTEPPQANEPAGPA